MSNVKRISGDIIPVRVAIADLQAHATEISGLVVLVATNNDEDYNYYVAGTIVAERAIGRLEIVKRAIMDKVEK